MMSNPAQEEADRLFGAGNHHRQQPNISHPEDQDTSDRDDNDSDANRPQRHTIRSGGGRQRQLRHGSESDEDNDNDDDDDDMTAATTTTTAKNAYTLPSAAHYANTGPKGVIADAQNYHRSKRRAFRQTLDTISHNLSLGSRPKRADAAEKPAARKTSDDSGSDEDDDDDEFMQQWRQQRLAELQDQANAHNPSHHHQQRRASPSVRTYGRLDAVDANGYLDAIEKCAAEAVVVVLLYDETSAASSQVEAELERLAYRYGHVHFVKLPHEVAEMEAVQIPAVLAYRGGDVFATISGAESEGLEGVLKDQGVLARR